MATEEMNIWDAAKEDAAKRTMSVGWEKRRTKLKSITDKPIALMRLVLLLMIFYALRHYVPAFINLKPILKQNNLQSGAQAQIDNRKNSSFISPLRNQLKLRKAYIRKGQTIQAQYSLPANANANITIKRCKRIIFIEAFNCQVLQAETINLSGDTIGTRRFKVAESAMYFLESHVEVQPGEEFDITWRRN